MPQREADSSTGDANSRSTAMPDDSLGRNTIFADYGTANEPTWSAALPAPNKVRIESRRRAVDQALGLLFRNGKEQGAEEERLLVNEEISTRLWWSWPILLLTMGSILDRQHMRTIASTQSGRSNAPTSLKKGDSDV